MTLTNNCLLVIIRAQEGMVGLFRKGKNWYIDYHVEGWRKREKIGPNRRQAELVLQKRKV